MIDIFRDAAVPDALNIHGRESCRGRGDTARSLNRGGVGYYPKPNFVHVDTGRIRYW